MVAALRRSVNRVIDVIAPAFRAERDWPHGIAAALDAYFAYLVIEQPFAQFGGVDVHLGSRLVVDVREQLLTTAQAFFAEGFREHGEVPPVAGEAIGAALDALLFDQIANWAVDPLRGRPDRRLPRARAVRRRRRGVRDRQWVTAPGRSDSLPRGVRPQLLLAGLHRPAEAWPQDRHDPPGRQGRQVPSNT